MCLRLRLKWVFKTSSLRWVRIILSCKSCKASTERSEDGYKDWTRTLLHISQRRPSGEWGAGGSKRRCLLFRTDLWLHLSEMTNTSLFIWVFKVTHLYWSAATDRTVNTPWVCVSVCVTASPPHTLTHTYSTVTERLIPSGQPVWGWYKSIRATACVCV